MVNTELLESQLPTEANYNILNIVVNTEPPTFFSKILWYYNILNIVVNTERLKFKVRLIRYYNILNIVVNTER